MERALAISAARNDLKLLFRGGLFPESRMPTAVDVLREYRTAEEIIRAAQRTDLGFNVAGGAVVAGTAYNHFGP